MQVGGDLDPNAQAVAIAQAFQGEVVFDRFEFSSERNHSLPRAMDRVAHQLAESFDGLFGAIGILRDQRRDAI